jgi:hypothetical protein
MKKRGGLGIKRYCFIQHMRPSIEEIAFSPLQQWQFGQEQWRHARHATQNKDGTPDALAFK